MRSKVQTVTPAKAAEFLRHNSRNRPLSKRIVGEYAEAMRRGEWQSTHQGIAFDVTGGLIDGQHRLAAIVEAGVPVELLVFTDAPAESFDVVDTGKRRRAADVLAIEGEKSATMLASMVRTVWHYDNRPDYGWSGGDAAVTNHQIVQTLAEQPEIRDFITFGERIAVATSMIKSAAGAASYLISHADPTRDLTEWFDGIVEGTGLGKGDPRLLFRRAMFTRRQAGQPQRRHDTREHVTLYLKAFNAWATNTALPQLRYAARERVPSITPR